MTYESETPPPNMSKRRGRGSYYHAERILSSVSSPPIAATFPLRGAHTLRLARIINSTEERKIRKWVPSPDCLEEWGRVGYSYVKPTVFLLTAKSLTVFYNHLTIRENSRGGLLAFLLSLYGTMPLIRLRRSST